MFIPSFIIGVAYMHFSDGLELFDVTVLALINDELFTSYVFFELMPNNILDEIAGVLFAGEQMDRATLLELVEAALGGPSSVLSEALSAQRPESKLDS